MTKRICLILTCLALALLTGFAQTQNPPAQEPAPDVAGSWTGVWSSYNPAQGGSTPKDLCKNLSAKIELKEGQKDGVWQAVFEGDCGRPYKYSIKMEGRQVGKVVLFKGTTDLGKQDGGVYDWIGRANDKEFVGFFTSAFYTGTFNLARGK